MEVPDDTPMKTLPLTSRRHFKSSSKKKPVFIPGVTTVEEVGEEEDQDDHDIIQLRGCDALDQDLSCSRDHKLALLEAQTARRRSVLAPRR